MKKIETESTNVELETVRCSWCGSIDKKEKVYAPTNEDGVVYTRPFHKECFKASKIFTVLAIGNSEEPTEVLVEMANVMAGVEK